MTLQLKEFAKASNMNTTGYVSFWKCKLVEESKPAFTDMQLALMEGGHSLEEKKTEKFPFLKELKQNTLP